MMPFVGGVVSVNLVMTVIGFGVSTLFIVFVCTRLICARIHLRRNARAAHALASFPSSSYAAAADLTTMERSIRGLEPTVVASFPTEKFGEWSLHSGDGNQCVICLLEYQEKDILRILPYCGHAFHLTCIDIWLKQHSTCPVCRVSLRDSPHRTRSMPTVSSAATRSSIYSPNPHISDPWHRHMQFAGQRCSTRTSDNQIIQCSHQDQLISNPSVSGGNSCTLSEVNSSVGNDRHDRTVRKHVDSPSYS